MQSVVSVRLSVCTPSFDQLTLDLYIFASVWIMTTARWGLRVIGQDGGSMQNVCVSLSLTPNLLFSFFSVACELWSTS